MQWHKSESGKIHYLVNNEGEVVRTIFTEGSTFTLGLDRRFIDLDKAKFAAEDDYLEEKVARECSSKSARRLKDAALGIACAIAAATLLVIILSGVREWRNEPSQAETVSSIASDLSEISEVVNESTEQR